MVTINNKEEKTNTQLMNLRTKNEKNNEREKGVAASDSIIST